MATVSANCPQVVSVQTGGVSPVGLEGFDTWNGPPVKVMTGFVGESVPLAGVVAAQTAAVMLAAAMTNNVNKKILNCKLLPICCRASCVITVLLLCDASLSVHAPPLASSGSIAN